MNFLLPIYIWPIPRLLSRGEKHCGAVYDQGCEPLQYKVEIRTPEAQRQLENGLFVIVTEGLLQNEYKTVVPALFDIDGQFVLKDSTVTEKFCNFTIPSMPSCTPSQPLDYPFHASFEVAVPGAIRLCRKVFSKRVSEEGSCIYQKTGALLSFTPYSNRKVGELLTTQKQFVVKASLCAELCLLRPDICNGFLFVYREEGNKKEEDNCQFVFTPGARCFGGSLWECGLG
jgi:hypothetical protein